MQDQTRTRLFVPRDVSWAAGFLPSRTIKPSRCASGVIRQRAFAGDDRFRLDSRLGLAQSIAAIGLLRLKPWARTLGVVAGAIGAAEWSLTVVVLPLGSWIISVVGLVSGLALYYRFLAPVVDATTRAAIASAESAQGKVEFIS